MIQNRNKQERMTSKDCTLFFTSIGMLIDTETEVIDNGNDTYHVYLDHGRELDYFCRCGERISSRWANDPFDKKSVLAKYIFSNEKKKMHYRVYTLCCSNDCKERTMDLLRKDERKRKKIETAVLLTFKRF